MLTIGMDATQLVPRRTGLGRYQEDLLQGLIQLPNIRLILLAAPNHTIPAHPNTEIRILNKLLSNISPGLALLAASPDRLKGVDLFLATRVLRPLRWSGASATVVHDLYWIENPGGMQTTSRLAHCLFANHIIHSSALIVSDSPRTTQGIIRHLQPKQQLLELPPGISSDFVSDGGIDVVPNQLLLVGGQTPGKNGVTALKAFAKLAESRPSMRLIIVGGKSWKNDAMLNLFQQLPSIVQARIEALGFVDDQTLIRLYRSSALTIFPSLHEGYGYPTLESMACGTPVLVSDRVPTSDYLPSQSYALPPTDVDAWCHSIAGILDDLPSHRRLFADHWQQIRARFSLKFYTQQLISHAQQALQRRQS